MWSAASVLPEVPRSLRCWHGYPTPSEAEERQAARRDADHIAFRFLDRSWNVKSGYTISSGYLYGVIEVRLSPLVYL